MTKRYFLGPIILATALWISCGGGTGPSRPSAAGSNTQESLTIGANSLDFGSVSVGRSKTSSLAVSNTSNNHQNITVSQITVKGKGFKLSPAPALPFVLTAGQSLTLAVSFSPKIAGPVSGNLSIKCDATGPNPSISLSGSGLGIGQLAVSPSTINFGSALVGQSTAQTGTLTAGGSSIRVSSAAWNGQGYSVSGITFPAIVPANQSISFTVTFAPQTEGTSSGSITFVSNATNSPNRETLTGTGAQPGHSVILSWNPSPSRVVGYNVYRGTRSGGPYTKLNRSPVRSTNYTDSSVQSGMTYYYVASSVGSHSAESAYSSQTTAVIPTP
jgi:hypothetical protein